MGEALDFLCRGQEQLVKSFAEICIVGRNRGQHAGMIEGTIQGQLQLADRSNDSRFQERIQVTEAFDLVQQRIEAAQELNMVFGKRRNVAIRENFE